MKFLKKKLLQLHAMPRVSVDDPLQGFKFRVSIPGLPKGLGFKKVTGLSKEIGFSEYDEGGYDSTHKIPGKMKTGELVCEKGLFTDTSIEQLMKQSLTDPNFRKTITIEVMDKSGRVGRKFTVIEAWSSKWEIGDIDASSEDVIAENITFQYEDIV